MYRYRTYEQRKASWEHELAMQLLWQRARKIVAVLAILMSVGGVSGAILMGLWMAARIGMNIACN